MKHVLEYYRGSDVTYPGTIKDDAGVAIDLTGYTLTAFEPSAELAPHLTLTITDAVAGAYSIAIAWSDTFPSGMRMSFRLQFSIDGRDEASPPIWIKLL